MSEWVKPPRNLRDWASCPRCFEWVWFWRSNKQRGIGPRTKLHCDGCNVQWRARIRVWRKRKNND